MATLIFDDLAIYKYPTDEFDLEINPRKVNTAHDLLVLGCVLYRITNEDGKYRAFSITNDHKFLSGLVTKTDIVQANTIRDYYKGKLITFTIQKGTLSKFKKDLHTFLNTEYHVNGAYSTPEIFAPMCYKLPHFYNYDTTQTSLFENNNYKLKGDIKVQCTKELTFLKKLNTATKKSAGKLEYWFKEANGNRVVLIVDTKNPLLGAFDILLDKPIKVESIFHARTHYAVEYYVSNAFWKLTL